MVIRTIRAHYTEIVEVQWTLADGSVLVERRTSNEATDNRDARLLAEHLHAHGRNAAGQVTDRTQSNEAGQRYMTAPLGRLDGDSER